MTEAEKNEIVGLVMTEISSQAVDFDIETEQPQANDLLTAVREVAGRYVGVTLKWDDVARIATELANQAVKKAEQAKNDAVTAKNIAQEILTGVQNKETDITNFVTTSKAEIETQKNESVEAVQSIYRTDFNAINDRIMPIDFRITDPNKVILDVDVTGTMENFVDGMEQEPNEAIALTLEPDVPTVDTHNFGVRGQICIDGNYLYVCVADNTWKKIPLQEL